MCVCVCVGGCMRVRVWACEVVMTRSCVVLQGGATPLWIGAGNGNPESIRELVLAKADPNKAAEVGVCPGR